METVDEVLAHFGVPGMKWGVRKLRPTSAPGEKVNVAVQKRPGKLTKASGGKNLPPTAEAVRVAKLRQKAKNSSTDSLSTKELQDLVQRMNLEQQYNNLSAKPRTNSLGAKFAKEVLLDVGKQQTKNALNTVIKGQVDDLLKGTGFVPLSADEATKRASAAPGFLLKKAIKLQKKK